MIAALSPWILWVWWVPVPVRPAAPMVPPPPAVTQPARPLDADWSRTLTRRT